MSSKLCRLETSKYDRTSGKWLPIPFGKKEMCPYLDCKFKHTVARSPPCPLNLECRDYECSLLHSHSRQKPCKFGNSCIRPDCTFSHPVDRVIPCPNGANCYAYLTTSGNCTLGHPFKMNRVCRDDLHCKAFNCPFVHGEKISTNCPNGTNCMDMFTTCPYIHPSVTDIVYDSSGSAHLINS